MESTTPITDILCPGKIVQIEVVNHFGNKIITKTTVCRMDDQNLMLNLPQKEGTFNQVNPDVDVTVVCKHQEEPQDYTFLTKFIMVKEEDPPLVILSRPMEPTVGHLVVRHNVSLPFSYFINNREIKGGMIKDLSCFGLLAAIKPDASLEVGLGLLFKLILTTSPSPLLVMGTIVKLIKAESDYQVGLDFSHLPEAIQDQITKYLFSLQKPGVKKEPQPKSAFIKIN